VVVLLSRRSPSTTEAPVPKIHSVRDATVPGIVGATRRLSRRVREPCVDQLLHARDSYRFVPETAPLPPWHPHAHRHFRPCL